MSSNIVLLSLSNWTESHIKAIYNATSQTDTSTALDNFLSKDAVIVVNGKKISSTDLSKELQSEKFLEVGASVDFLNILEVPADKTAPVKVSCLYFYSNFEKTDDCYGRLSGWVSWNFLHRYHFRIYQSQRCACDPHSHCVSQCLVRLIFCDLTLVQPFIDERPGVTFFLQH